MKKLLFFFLAAFALCLSLVATTHMCVQLKNGNILKYNVEDVEQVFYEKSGNITPYDSTAIDTTTSLNYRITSDSTAEVISYNYINPSGAVSIPSKILIDGNPYTITSIGQNAFRGCYSMTSIDMPESITSLGWDVFNGCTGLTSIKIPSKVTVISVGLFNGCTNLTTIELPDGITTIENYGFHKCHKLKNIKLPYGVTSLGNSSFAWCYDLTSLEIPESVTTLCQYAFHGCTGLTRIDLPSSVIDIRIYAFYLCSNLDVIIDNYKENVTTGEGAFEECHSVIYLRDNDTTAVDTSATPLRFRITSDSTAEVIKGDSYDSYTGFRSITIPEKVKIDGKVYDVTSIGEHAFQNCEKLVRIEIPQSIKVIKRGAFMGCDSLRTVELPESLDSIGNAVFCGCENLESINIPKNITCIGDSTFEWCYNLRHIEIPEKVSNIKFYAFFECTNLDVIIDNSEDNVRIGKEAFKGCKSVTFLKENDQTAIDTSATPLKFRITSDSTAEVIHDLYHQYHNNYNKFDTIMIPEKVKIDGHIYTVTSIGESAFKYCDSLKHISIPSSVNNIGDRAFLYCATMENIDLPSNVKTIGEMAFDSCYQLKNIIIPESVRSIGDEAFHGCYDLEPQLVIYDNGTKCHGWIGDSDYCIDIILPESVTSIDNHAFYYCNRLTSINIPDSVTSIGQYAFCWCGGLTSIRIPNSVTSIGDGAFYGCNGLDIVIDNSKGKVEIGDYAFDNCKSVTYLK